MKRTLLIVALGFACALTQAQAQPPKKARPAAQQVVPDTLADLKAEFEFQERELAPYLELYEQAKQKKAACVRAIFDDPLGHIGCNAQDREIALVSSMAEPTAQKFNAAKDAYERAQRKAERNKTAR